MTNKEKMMIEKLTNDFRNWLTEEVENEGFFWDCFEAEDDYRATELVSILFEMRKDEVNMDICWC